MTLGELREKLYDPSCDVIDKNYRIILLVKRLYDAEKNDLVMEITQQMLLRLRESSPHVYAVTIGQFPDFAGIHDYWAENGCVDGRGFTWLLPTPFGPYNHEWRYEKRYGKRKNVGSPISVR